MALSEMYSPDGALTSEAFARWRYVVEWNIRKMALSEKYSLDDALSIETFARWRYVVKWTIRWMALCQTKHSLNDAM